MTRVLIADDHALFRQGLRSLLETFENIEVVGEAEDGHRVLELAASLEPDLVLMDIAMPGCDGLEATHRLKERYPHIKILIVSMHADHPFVRQALKAGASGYIFKGASFEELKKALDNVIRDTPYLSPEMLSNILDDYKNNSFGDEAFSAYEQLTFREKEIFKMLNEGLGRQEIANALFISPKTVDRHKSNLKKKLGISSDLEIQKFARLLGDI